MKEFSLVPNYVLDEKQKDREEIEKLTQEFLKSGGKINEIKPPEKEVKLYKPVSMYGKNSSSKYD